MFEVGDKVLVVKKGDQRTTCWVNSTMDKYVDDGKEYVVVSSTDTEGDTRVDCGNGIWYFPDGCIRLAKSTDLLTNIEEVHSYRYNSSLFDTKDNLVGHIANCMISSFTDKTISEKSINELIKQLEELKEVCQKLK